MRPVRTSLALAALALSSVLASPSASAEPMTTDLAALRRESTTIATGTVTVASGHATVAVDGSLRGATPGVPLTFAAPTSSHASLTGQRVIVFGDAKGELRWYGKAIAGPDLEHGVILLGGFYDFNASLVFPGLFSFGQLKDYLATGAVPTRTFVGTLAFPNGHGGSAPSTKHFVVTLAPGAAPAVTGFTIACQRFAGVSGLDWGEFDVDFSDTCLKSGRARSLRLRGKPTGVDAMGNVTVVVAPASPILREAEYDAFIADGAIVDVERVVRLTGADGSHWTWNIEDKLIDGAGTARAITVNHGTTIAPASAGGTREDTWSFTDVTLRFTQRGPAALGLGTTAELVSAIDSGVGTWTLEKKGAAPVRVTMVQDKPNFVRR